MRTVDHCQCDRRPEAIESLFILYRTTGNSSYREAAWAMFENIERTTSTTIGSAAVSDVTKSPFQQVDRMESFWLAETLKYFYLMFSEPDLVSLDAYVL